MKESCEPTTEEWIEELTAIAYRIPAASLQSRNGNDAKGSSDLAELSMIPQIFVPRERLSDAFAAIRSGFAENPDPEIQTSGWEQFLEASPSVQRTFKEIKQQ